MTMHVTTTEPHLQLIHSAPVTQEHSHTLALPDILQISEEECAANIAEMFAYGLLRRVSLEELQNPHAKIQLQSESFELHELLCEMRSLTWFEAEDGALTGLTDEERARRDSFVNQEGQLTLANLFCAGIASAKDQPGEVLNFVNQDQPQEQSLINIAHQLVETHPSKVFADVAQSFLSLGLATDHGLCGWDDPASYLQSLFGEAEIYSARAAQAIQARATRMNRPAVLTARMSVALSMAETVGTETSSVHSIASELSTQAPNLLRWVSDSNRNAERPARFEPNLFLPMMDGDDMPFYASDMAGHVVLAGALGTLIKAWLQSPKDHLQAVDGRASYFDASQKIDNICADFCRARTVAGIAYPAESVQELRIGQTIAMQILRGALESRNQSAELKFTDLDGQIVTIQSSSRPFGRGTARLLQNGSPVAWPEDEARPAAHLHAVS